MCLSARYDKPLIDGIIPVDDREKVRVTAINTGAPHAVVFVPNVETINVNEMGRRIRSLTHIFPLGTNVDFVQVEGECLRLRTYERGVECETLACGTGAAASVVASFLKGVIRPVERALVHMPGGTLEVRLKTEKETLVRVYLSGPVAISFWG